MEKEKSTISEKNSYYTKMANSSISKHKECLDKFTMNFENEVKLNSKTPLFLDTNVLLRYYSISFVARKKLFEFFKKNNSRLYLTSQIQAEYLKNREDNIHRFFEQVTSKIPQNFKDNIINQMQAFGDNNKVVLKDYPFVEEGIENYQVELKKLLEKLNSEIKTKKKEHNNLISKDTLLDFLTTCNQAEELNDDELKLVKQHFEILRQDITNESVDSVINKINGAFPGIGDIKEKPKDPYGDYIIFHEIMKFMINKETNAVFLTFDNTKGDWMKKNKTTYLHYVQNIYNNTGKILYIIDADRALSEILNVDIKSLIPEKVNKKETAITSATLLSLATESLIFEGASVVSFDKHIIKELLINGYTSIEQIKNDLNSVESEVLQFRKKYPHLNTVGIMRWGLRIANSDYKLEVNDENGAITQFTSKIHEEYRKGSNFEE